MTDPGEHIFRLFIRADWAADAACRGMDTNLFHPTRGGNGDQAKAVCAGCPVASQCLQMALDNGEKHGIWGGVSINSHRRGRSRPRRDTWRPSRGPQPHLWTPIAHGTIAGYAAEKRRDGVDICDACREAYRTYRSDRRAKGLVA